MLELLLIIMFFALLMLPVNVSMGNCDNNDNDDADAISNEEAFGIVFKDIEEPVPEENIVYDTAFKETKIKSKFYNYTRKDTVEFMSAMLNKGFTATDIAAWVI